MAYESSLLKVAKADFVFNRRFQSKCSAVKEILFIYIYILDCREIQRAASAEEENRLMELALERRNSTEQQLQQVVRDQVGWPHFSRLFMISALQNDGTRDLRVNLGKPFRSNSQKKETLSGPSQTGSNRCHAVMRYN